MPELPEVQTVVSDLNATIKGKILEGIEVFYHTTLINKLDDEIQYSRIKEVERKGKYIVIHQDNEFIIIVHLRMTGKLIYSANFEPLLKHERARFTFVDGSILMFDDVRTFGKVTFIKKTNLPDYFKNLGVEPLSEDFNIEYIKDNTSRISIPIKSYLLDQRRIAGIGNIYACEILYRAGLNPLVPTKEVSLAKLKLIVKETKQILSEAIECNGTTISDYRRVDNKTGSFQNFLRVYGKTQCPKGHDITRVKISGRSTFYCEKCQK